MKTGILYQWLPFVAGYGIIWIAMALVNTRRETTIEDPGLSEQEGGLKMFFIGFFPTLFLLGVSVFIPLAGVPFLVPGLAVITVGIMIYFAALGAHRGSEPLAVTGIYRWSRNPMYVGGFFFFSGLALTGWQNMPANYIYLAGLIAWLAAVHYMVRREEYFLSGKYGDQYTEYCRCTSRYLGVTGG